MLVFSSFPNRDTNLNLIKTYLNVVKLLCSSASSAVIWVVTGRRFCLIFFRGGGLFSDVYVTELRLPDAFSLRDKSSMGVVTRITPGGREVSSSSESESS